MKRIIRFSKYFIPAAVLSFILVAFGIAGYFYMGFNLGVDFQAGLLQEVQFAPTAFSLTYDGPGNASVSLSRSSLDIVVSGAAVEELTHSFPFTSYPALRDLIRGLREIDGLHVAESILSIDVRSSWLIQSAQSTPLLATELPFIIHYLPPNLAPIRIEELRSSLLPLGTVSVQVLGTPAERRFMIRMEDSELGNDNRMPSERIIAALESNFGQGEVAVTRSDYVGSRFSKQLSDQAGMLTVMTLLLILAYCSIRFKVQFAMGAVLGIVHDAIIMVAFVVWTRMEFNTTTIAALLTILGYSINDKVVVFDRMKETWRIYPDDTFVNILNRSITETLSRTIITTFTTMLAVFSLYAFTSGSMKDFALALIIGMVSGVYSTIFIASGFVYLWEGRKLKMGKKKLKAVPAKA